jgi:hypothetical protein
MTGSGLEPARERAVEDALDILNAAKLCAVIIFGVPGTAGGGLATNMEVEDVPTVLAYALKRATTERSIEFPIGSDSIQ